MRTDHLCPTSPRDGHLLVTDRRPIYTREGKDAVVLIFSDIEPVSLVKMRVEKERFPGTYWRYRIPR